MKFSIAVLSLVSSALAAYVPSEPWSTLTPTATQTASCAVSDYTQSFGIAISTITSAVNVKAKRDVTQTADGQVEVNTATEESFSTITFSYSSTTATAASHSEVIATQIGDGQIQAPAPQSSSYEYRTISSKTEEPSSSSTACPTAIAKEATCKNSNDLAITLKDGVLKDSHDRIGSIVSNRQFQFDGPTPQAGAIYAGGWSIVDGKLALGDDDIFWECLSGDFYNLYDEAIAEQCTPVALSIVDLVDC